ncbi:PREDICTED: serine carboxypeptidase-like 40 isoform X2 [Nelumbo nucifera]|uniref:Carboxypeptidase n=1 Tax=Nelumbo nucifera TaxID=4432 RepID=A0A1U8BH31_NELNU|nr:PREDICTED: serine carboxypeptidase-like 40 isoform X2 [Nelumbo nucifera]
MKKVDLVICFLLSLSCYVAQSHGRQADALARLYQAKLQNKAGIDLTSSYEMKMTQIINEAEVLPQEGLKEKDMIERLPGQPPVGFKQYGGYVTVDESAGRALFYYFVEAQDPKSKPLLLWLNGGPGCSSLGYGAMEELGPFRVHSDGKTLYENRYSWNRGFSYSNRTSDYATRGDQSTAEDNYVFLVNWLERFPEYKTRDFYIAGESYAGHYVPQFAHTILQHNKIEQNNIINLKGIMIGNAVINDETDQKGMYDYAWTHALSSDETNIAINKYCNFSESELEWSDECINSTNEAFMNEVLIDIYNIYGSQCFSSNLTEKPKKASLMNFDPCSDNYVVAYLNQPDVQEALHANITKLKYDWQPCSDVLTKWNDSPSTVVYLLQEFMDNGIRVLVFSGDVDGRVPVTSTRYSLNKLQLQVNTSWYPWYTKREVGGYTVVYKGGLTFATVRGAGHEVPSYQPLRALTLVNYFLHGKPLPRNA